MSTLDKKFGSGIRFYRINRNLTQKELAKKCGITNVHLCNIETGNSSASIGTLDRIFRELEIQCEIKFLPKG